MIEKLLTININDKTAIHSKQYGRGYTYTLFIGENPFGKRGGTYGNVVSAHSDFYFHRSLVAAENMKAFINKIITILKQAKLDTLSINIEEYFEIHKFKTIDKVIDDIIIDALKSLENNFYKAFIYQQMHK